MSENSPQIHIISGPNGAGKSSHARVTLLPDFLSSNVFVNADEIAKFLSPEDPEASAIEAGRLMLNKIDFLLESKTNFALETTLSANCYLKLIKRAQKLGYKVNLFFLRLETAELAKQRVLTRVSKGGHNIPPNVIERRFVRGLDNLKKYLKVVDTAIVYEASGLELIEVARKNKKDLTILDKNLWKKIYA